MGEITKITSEKTEARRNNKIALVQKKERVKNKAVPAVDNILHLQRTIGNQAVQGLFKSGVLQAKLKIGKPGDKYEQEADRVAEQAMRMPEMTDCLECKENGEEPVQTKAITTRITPLVRRQVDTEEEEEEPIQGKLESLVLQKQAEEEEEEEIQTKSIVEEISPLVQKQDEEEEEEEPIQSKLDSPILQKQVEPEEEEEEIQTKSNSSNTAVASSGIESSINSLKGGGQPLSESTRKYFEPRFGSNFSQVRVHNNSQAANIAKSINAKAFTTGRNIVFGPGQYSPETSGGKRLLAHELTHVVQQTGVTRAFNGLTIQRARDCDSAEASLPFSFGFDITRHIYSRSFRVNSSSLSLETQARYKRSGAFEPGDYCFKLKRCRWWSDEDCGNKCFAIDGTTRTASWTDLEEGDIYYFYIWKGMQDGLEISGTGEAS
jgi:hypothetical protein